MTQTDNKDVEQKTFQEELQVMGEQLLTRVKELIHEGNVRRIIIKQEDHTLVEIPLSVGIGVGIVSVLTAPMLAALGAIGALLTKCTIEVVRTETQTTPPEEPPAAV